MQKVAIFLSILFSCSLLSAQSLTGNWKFARIEYSTSSYFDLDSLDKSYALYFNYQQKNLLPAALTAADSLRIKKAFTGIVNEIEQMFINFSGTTYTTNKYYSDGALSKGQQKGTYTYSPATKMLTLRQAGQTKIPTSFQVLSVTPTRLLLKSNDGPSSPVFICRRVK